MSLFVPLQQNGTTNKKKASWPIMRSYHHRLTMGFKRGKKYSFCLWLLSPLGMWWKTWQAVTNLEDCPWRCWGWALSRLSDGPYFSLWELIRLGFWITHLQSRLLKSRVTSLRRALQMEMGSLKRRNELRSAHLCLYPNWISRTFSADPVQEIDS